MNLVDKDGLLANVLDSISLLRPEYDTQENKEFLANNLLNNLIFEKNLIARKEIAHAHQLFWFIQRYILWLLRVYLSNDNHWESPTKKLEEDIPAEWYEKYRKCIPVMEEQSLQNSFTAALELADFLFTELAVPVPIHNVLKNLKNDQ